jgi:hypothetical protein
LFHHCFISFLNVFKALYCKGVFSNKLIFLVIFLYIEAILVVFLFVYYEYFIFCMQGLFICICFRFVFVKKKEFVLLSFDKPFVFQLFA